ncbi:hypothetical protein POTOM_016306 [Populus tomentosa]|uniref:Scarecrow-like protein 3 n=1 Tax=Populus tomentosa TaxID=118781 RepID=A0A8X8D6B9_POPTO|nr:hypothetical protein POTOM_016306 [Populus tomentosa]
MSSMTPLLKPDVTLSLTLSPSSPSPHDQTLKPEDRGIRLIQLLLKCAKHASSGNLHRADACLLEISVLSSILGDCMQRLAARFASALAFRLVKRWPGLHKALNQAQQPKVDRDRAKLLFTRTFPYLSFAYAIIAKTLLHAMANERVIHIVDLGSGDSQLWVALLRGFANSPHGPPHLKITCVNGSKAILEKLGQRLVKEAENVGVPFQFNSINASLRELTKDMFRAGSGEALAFVSILNLHVLLSEDDQVAAHFGANKSVDGIKDCKQIGDFLAMIRSMSPTLLFVVEQEADHNLNRLVDRFVEGLNYYSAVFDSIDATSASNLAGDERLVLEEMFGREIKNIVACEGPERIERHERYARWVVRLAQAGFKPVQFRHDSGEDAKQVMDAFGKNGYKAVLERTVGDGGNDGSSGGGGLPFYNLGVNGMGSYPFAGHGEGDHMFTSSAGLHFK